MNTLGIIFAMLLVACLVAFGLCIMIDGKEKYRGGGGMTDLKPCPFCGSSDVSMREITNYCNYAFKGIFCNGCQTFHVAWKSDENRIESWNRRVGE